MVAKNMKKNLSVPHPLRGKHFSAISWYFSLVLPGALHIGANIGWRQYFCLVQIFGILVTYFSTLVKSATKLKSSGKHDILMATSEQIRTDLQNIGEVAKVSSKS
jgi:hypothetical protein